MPYRASLFADGAITLYYCAIPVVPFAPIVPYCAITVILCTSLYCVILLLCPVVQYLWPTVPSLTVSQPNDYHNITVQYFGIVGSSFATTVAYCPIILFFCAIIVICPNVSSLSYCVITTPYFAITLDYWSIAMSYWVITMPYWVMMLAYCAITLSYGDFRVVYCGIIVHLLSHHSAMLNNYFATMCHMSLHCPYWVIRVLSCAIIMSYFVITASVCHHCGLLCYHIPYCAIIAS